MRQFKLIVPTLLIALALVACGHEEHDHDHDKKNGKTEKHDDHKDGEGHHSGEAHALGSGTADAFKVTVTQRGDLEAGGEGVFEIEVEGGSVAAVRAWFGAEDAGAGSSAKTKASKEKDDYDLHLELPDPLPKDGKLWVEVEDDKGKKSKASFATK